MATVRVLTTGVMEERALARSLGALFPDHSFVAHPRLDGFTSAPLPPDYNQLAERSGLRFNLDKFVNTAIGLFDPGRRQDRRPPDFVLAVEDLELVNAASPGNVVRSVRDAFTRNLASWPRDGVARERLVKAVRERCSFHLMAPMTEAYFFADAAAFTRATAPAPARPSQYDPTRDVEDFEVDHADYRDPAPHPDIRWTSRDRHRHPKHYLMFLTDPQLDGRHAYEESKHGVAALESLAWVDLACVATRPEAHLRFVRSLLADLCDMLDAAESGHAFSSLESRHCHPLTWPAPRAQVLRNL